MKKKIVGLLCLIIIISCSTILGQNLVTTIYDQQGNKYSLYDDHTWIMNDEILNNKTSASQFSGKYTIKEEGLKDLIKIGLILDGTYPDTDKWAEAVVLSNIAFGFLSAEDLMEMIEVNIYLKITKNQMEIRYKLENSDNNLVLDRVPPYSDKLGFYIQDNNLFILNNTGDLVCCGIFKNPDKFEINLINLIDEFGETKELNDIKSSFTGYERYLSLMLEKE